VRSGFFTTWGGGGGVGSLGAGIGAGSGFGADCSFSFSNASEIACCFSLYCSSAIFALLSIAAWRLRDLAISDEAWLLTFVLYLKTGSDFMRW
jgi:hypothetical protein